MVAATESTPPPPPQPLPSSLLESKVNDISATDDDHLHGKLKRKSTTKRARTTTQYHVRDDTDVTLDDFTILQSSHPYGVLPTGNRFFDSNHNDYEDDATITTTIITEDTTTTGTTKNPTDLLYNNEECWNTILSYCDGKSLSKLCQVGRFFYVASQQPELWRDLVLLLQQQEQQQLPPPPPPSLSLLQLVALPKTPGDNNNAVISHQKNNTNSYTTITRVGKSWKETFVLLHSSRNHSYNNSKIMEASTATATGTPPPRVVPISVQGFIYSDYYYRLHTCRSFAIPKVWLSSSKTSAIAVVGKKPRNNHRPNTNRHNNNNHVMAIPVEVMTTERFLQEFERPNIPVNIVGGCRDWKAYQQWCHPNYIQQQCSGASATTTIAGEQQQQSSSSSSHVVQQQQQQQTFRTTSGVAPYPAQFTFEAYYNYCTGTGTSGTGGDNDKVAATDTSQCCATDANDVTTTATTTTNGVYPNEIDDDNHHHHEHLLEEGPLYLFDRTALQPESILWKDYMYDLQRTCPYWDPNPNHSKNTTTTNNDANNGGHDLFGLLGEGRRPDHTWLICGPKRSGSVFHIDPNGTHAWNATIVGHKRWIFYPPGVTPPGVYPSEDGDEVALPLTIGEWIYQYWDKHCDRKHHSTATADNNVQQLRPLECTTRPGDIVFVPHGWWHLVINLDEWNVAVTHNYVSRSNLCNVLRFLRDKREQVSGCRDRDDSIKPEHLYEEFVSTLQQHHPKWLQEALDVPNWTCRAWKKNITSPKGRSKNVAVSSTTRATSVIEKAKSGGSATFNFSFDT